MLVVCKVLYDFIAEAYSPGVSLESEGAQVKPLSPINGAHFTVLFVSRSPYYARMLH